MRLDTGYMNLKIQKWVNNEQGKTVIISKQYLNLKLLNACDIGVCSKFKLNWMIVISDPSGSLKNESDLIEICREAIGDSNSAHKSKFSKPTRMT